jgi:hypothetical protein
VPYLCLRPQRVKIVPSLCFQSVNRVDTLNNTGEAFVDDSNLGCTFTLLVIPHHVSPVDQQLHSVSGLTNLQMLAQGWERALFTTGGAINFRKSFWFLFHWEWKNGEARLVPPPVSLRLLTEGDNLDSSVLVPQKSVHDMYRTLGVHLSPSGDTTKVAQVLLGKAKD